MEEQHSAYERYHGHPMSVEMAESTRGILVVLGDLYFAEADAVANFSDATYWESLGRGLHVSAAPFAGLPPPPCGSEPIFVTERTAETLKSLEAEGNAVVRGDPAFSRTRPLLERAVRALGDEGWPPAFIFVFDEAWHLVDGLFEVVAPTLGADLMMEPDLNCWRLRAHDALSEEKDHLPTPYVGCNFSQPHRDMRYDACHSADDVFSSLSAWTPVNESGARARNGAMRVIRIDDDDFYHSPEHPYHSDSKTALGFDEELADHTKVLDCDAGDVCLWVPSVVHWGGAVAAPSSDESDHQIEPRISIAATFRRGSAPRSAFGAISDSVAADAESTEGGPRPQPADTEEEMGPLPVSRLAMRTLPFSARLAHVAKALLAYAHWYPSFPGLRVERLRAGSSRTFDPSS